MISTKKRQLAETLQERLRDNYFEGFSSPIFFDEIYYSRAYCQRVFKEVTGKSMLDYLTELRFEKAKELLKTTTMKCYEIVYSVGYESSTVFNTRFKAKYGMTMREYRCGSTLQSIAS